MLFLTKGTIQRDFLYPSMVCLGKGTNVACPIVSSSYLLPQIGCCAGQLAYLLLSKLGMLHEL